ncbi:MAG: low molecular weight phosphotyrosine protein phosphatase [Gammaproteobacteria bacterium]|nr:low molecular weight phosphotyrosine protein phosphatase [Gammaproteobacteria bacterium]NIR85481.1 low molecular weight phosphotyrosine protein phosphatase [Gammaproteobacteria bacterium]NIR89533.1 low molecular weight phosphotyrosine protein phosphatase [Gammaproteobacteria bacterium]NIU06618.1 low molecular weight phosphotyrosine protein phosphatase [Gammaproteobacteria bacterium]NIV53501.1 low molecular weight phosphotyrosine protein phosphatase [Gammaproteobacteria bacterium]
MVKTLFVCMGNICRSPMAQGIMEHRVRERGWSEWLVVDSAGTHDFHVGKPPDPRAVAALLGRGVAIGAQRARRVVPGDFEIFDYVLAMDRANYEILQAACPPAVVHKVHLLLDFAAGIGEKEIPDPYYGGALGFERVLDLVELGVEGLLADIERRLAGGG